VIFLFGSFFFGWEPKKKYIERQKKHKE